MSCYLCDGVKSFPIYVLDADMYEESIGITYDRRMWSRCEYCGLYSQDNILTDHDLDRIYKVYRNVAMRGETVKEKFDRIVNLQNSENKTRIGLIVNEGFRDGSLLDIGSGLGVFPYEIKPYMKEVRCIEPNADSADFINSLGIKCHNGFYKSDIFKKQFDFVSVIHVLEHQRNPIGFLKQVARDLKPNGVLYIEVPDAIEFEYLDRNDDEFNSNHLWMFDLATLYRVCQKAKLTPFYIKRTLYGERKLSRITLLARHA